VRGIEGERGGVRGSKRKGGLLTSSGSGGVMGEASAAAGGRRLSSPFRRT